METWLVLFYLLLLALLAVRLPIGFAMLLVGFLGFGFVLGFDGATKILPRIVYEQTANYPLIILPLFLLTGALALRSGVAQSAFDLAHRWLGQFRGGMAIATVGACALFGACSGSSIATSLTVGRISLPEMKRFGHSDALSTGTIAAAGTLGMLIPPSGMLVLYAILTEQSVGRLFIAGLIPGLLSAVIYMGGIYAYVLVNPQEAPTVVSSFSWRERFRAVYKAWGVFALVLTIIGGIYSGVVTVTEAAGAGAVVAFGMLMLVPNRWANIQHSFFEGARTTATIFLLLLGAFVFGRFIAITGVAANMAEAITAWPLGPYGTLIVILAFYIPLGMFLDPTSMLVITLPVVLPTVVALGFDPIWFGIIFVKISELGNITPPMGLHVFVIKGIAPPSVRIQDIFKGCSVFILLDILTIGLLVAFPGLVMWLPNTMS